MRMISIIRIVLFFFSLISIIITYDWFFTIFSVLINSISLILITIFIAILIILILLTLNFTHLFFICFSSVHYFSLLLLSLLFHELSLNFFKLFFSFLLLTLLLHFLMVNVNTERKNRSEGWGKLFLVKGHKCWWSNLG